MKRCLGCGIIYSDEWDRCSFCGFNSMQRIKINSIDGKEIELEERKIKDIDK